MYILFPLILFALFYINNSNASVIENGNYEMNVCVNAI